LRAVWLPSTITTRELGNSDAERGDWGRMGRTRRAVLGRTLIALLATTAASLTFVASASAATPSPQAPAPGSSFEAEDPPTFSATDSPPLGPVWLRVSSSPAVDPSGELGHDAGFEQMNPSSSDPTVFSWAPVNVGNSYPWAPGTYYWQVSQIECAASRPCYVNGPVWQFTITTPPPPQPVSPADNATASAGSVVQFVVDLAIARDLDVYIDLHTASGPMSIAPSGYSVDGHTSYFHVRLGNGTGHLPWNAYRYDCKLAPSCPEVFGPTRTLSIVAPASPAPPSASTSRCRPRSTQAKIGGRFVCLHGGEFCSWRHRRQYLRYGYACGRRGRWYRLKRLSVDTAASQVVAGLSGRIHTTHDATGFVGSPPVDPALVMH